MVRRVVLFVAFVLFAAACTTTSGGSTTTGDTPPGTTAGGAPPTTTLSPTTTAGEVAPTTTAPDLSGLDVPAEVRDQLASLIVDAQEVRGLAFIDPPNITVVSDDELEARVREAIEEEADDFPADEALYKLFGLMDAEANLETTLLNLYGEQVAGFYDGDTGEIVVPVRDDGFSLLQQATMIHELVHALTDQHFDFDGTFQAMIDEDRLDQATGYQALIEGDATFAEVQWVQGLSQSQLGQFVAESLEIDTSSLNAAPQFLRESLFFPYDTGLAFIQDIHGVGGWEAVNDVYSAFPETPPSSEQVITPGDYLRDLPVPVAIPDLTLAGYELERTSVWGERGLRIMLNQVVGDSTTARAADGWGGDSYHQWFDGENAAFLMVYEGDTPGDVAELEDALLDFAIQSVPDEAFVWVDTEDGLLYFIAADEFEIGEQIRSDVGLG